MPFAKRFSTPREAECKAEGKCLSRNLQKDNICAFTKGLIMKKLILCVISALILAGCDNWENVESVAAVSAVSAVASSSSKLPSEIPSEKKRVELFESKR